MRVLSLTFLCEYAKNVFYASMLNICFMRVWIKLFSMRVYLSLFHASMFDSFYASMYKSYAMRVLLNEFVHASMLNIHSMRVLTGSILLCEF